MANAACSSTITTAARNYMGDFIDIVAWGSTPRSAMVEYPRTRWLILMAPGTSALSSVTTATNNPTQVWYAAYPNYLRSTSGRTPGSVRGCCASKVNRRLIGCDSCGATGEAAAKPIVLERKICRPAGAAKGS
jgi:hypothetical protein